MKTLRFRWLIAALLVMTLTIFCVACQNDKPDDTDTTEDTTTAPVTEVEVTVEDTPTEAPTAPVTEAPEETTVEETTEEETTEEVTTLRELTWESYDPALDNSAVDQDVTPVVKPTTWVATDGLGRVVSTNTTTGDQREDKIVAIFYWTWHGSFGDSQTAFNNQQNLDKLYAAGYTKSDYWALSKAQLRNLGIYVNDTSYHFWDEPVYGYYDGDDEWVIRKQAELLASAGVDVVFFDNTNGSYTWIDTAMRVMKVFSEARAQGVNAPCVSFMLPFGPTTDGARPQLIELYNKIFSKGLYQDVWFYMDGKPMLMAHSNCLDTSNTQQKEIKEFFTFRTNIAGYLDKESGTNQWGWLSVYPQAYFHNAAGEVEQITVGVAVNHDYVTHKIAPMSGDNVIGRTWTSRGYDARENALYYGACFAQQWENALSVDPKVVFVTAWNEWVAMRLPDWAGMYQNCYVDQFNAEYSRDCEPSNGILKDYYYYQLVDYIRQFKGAEVIETASQEKLIDVNGGYGQFADVGPTYTDYIGLPDRDALGYRNPVDSKRFHYTNTSGRNDIYDCKVARDYENLYFMVRTVEDITPYTDDEWMHLYISTGESEQHWEYYEYVLNKNTPTSDKAYLERFTGNGYDSEIVGTVAYKVTGNVMIVCIPKTMLGIPAEQLDFTIDFKWTDNTGVDMGGLGDENDPDRVGDPLLWYVNGDVAPVGRFNYRYTTTAPETCTVPSVEQTRGYEMLDMTDAAVRAEFDEFILKNKSGCEYSWSDDGLVLKASAADASLMITYRNATCRFTTDSYKYVVVTYKTSDLKEIKLCGSGGKVSTANASRASTVALTSDGETHTAVLDYSEKKAWTNGYVDDFGFFFTSTGTITIQSVQFLKSLPEAE